PVAVAGRVLVARPVLTVIAVVRVPVVAVSCQVEAPALVAVLASVLDPVLVAAVEARAPRVLAALIPVVAVAAAAVVAASEDQIAHSGPGRHRRQRGRGDGAGRDPFHPHGLPLGAPASDQRGAPLVTPKSNCRA